MPHFDKHNKGMKALVDTSEALLNAMETNGIDPETVSNRPEFTVLVHFLKSIIDGELNIPNDLTEAIRRKSEEELGVNLDDIKKRLH